MKEPAASDRDQESLEGEEQWQELSRWSIVHFFFHSFITFIQPLFTMFLIGFISSERELNAVTMMLLIGWGLLASILILLPLAWLRHRKFRYAIVEKTIKVRQGVVFRKQLSLEFKRIQNVNIRHPFYFRPLDLVTLKIDGAGSSGEEVYLAALTTELADSIRAEIKRNKDLSQNSLNAEVGFSEQLDDELKANGQQEETFYSRSNADLVIHGLTNNRAWIIVGGFFAFTSTMPISYGDIIRWLTEAFNNVFGNQSVAFITALFIVSFILSIALLALLSVIMSIVTYYGYTLFRSDHSLMVHCGLLSKNEINMQKSRVQTVHIAQDWLGLLLKRNNVIYEQISLALNHQSGAVSGNKLVVPAVNCEERSQLMDEVLPEIGDPEKLSFLPASIRLFYRNTLVSLCCYFLLIVVVASFVTWSNYFLLILPIIAGHCFLLYMSWLRKGLARVKNMTILRQGVFGIEYFLFPDFKIQAVAHKQTLLMKRGGLSTITFLIASRTVSMPFIATGMVRDIIDRTVYTAEVTQKSYM